MSAATASSRSSTADPLDGTGFATLARLTCDLALPRPYTGPYRQENSAP